MPLSETLSAPSARRASSRRSASVLDGLVRRAPYVMQAERGDATVLADLRHGRYYTLTPVSARIWALLGEGAELTTLLAQLHTEYDAPAERIDADAVVLLERLRAAGLITCEARARAASNARPRDAGERHPPEPAGTSPPVGRERAGRALTVPSVLRCSRLLLGVKLALRLWGFGRTWQWVRRRATRIAVRGDVAPADLAATEYRVALIAALWPGRARCLEQSLVLYYVLRRAGVPAEFRLGIQPQPFLAHAWVDYHGVPVNDFPEHVAQLQPLEDVPR